MKRSLKILPVVGAIGAAAILPAAAASAGPAVPTLRGRAILPAEALSDGPPSGAAVGNGLVNGILFPRPSQPVIGFSAIVAGPSDGTYVAMPDNGFGAKTNSADFLIRAYEIRPKFKTAKGGSGDVEVGSYIQFRDPGRKFPYTMTRPDRLFTGADIDPESMQRGSSGDIWIGDEFGPWILHFNGQGVLLDAPFEVPGGLRSPNHPRVLSGQAPATHPNSRGFEAMAISPDGSKLYGILEGPTNAQGTTSTDRTVVEFSTGQKAFTSRTWTYRTETALYLVADAWALDANRLVVIERDAGRGLTAVFRNVYVVDLRAAPGSVVTKRQVVDLAAIADPNLVSLPEKYPGDVGLGNPFRVTCESVEAVHVLGPSRLLVGCDNNLPNSGRNPTRADDTELIVIDVPGLSTGH
jgi:glycerophosphoryl diester phosphodiesterase